MTETQTKPKLKILVGLPASGKSTWAKEQADFESDTIIVSRDSIRTMLKGEYKLFPFGSYMEDLVTDIERNSIYNALIRNYNVIVDACNFRKPFGITETPGGKELYHFGSNSLALHYDFEIEYVDFTHVPLKTCIQRDQQREHSIGKLVIESMNDRYLKDK